MCVCVSNAKLVLYAMMKIYALEKEHAVVYFKLKPVSERGFFWGHSKQLLLFCLGSQNWRSVREQLGASSRQDLIYKEGHGKRK